MPAKGVKAKVHSQSVSRKAVVKKVSDDSVIGSTSSSAAWSTREARLSASAVSTIGPLFQTIKSEQAEVIVEPPSSPRIIPQLGPPIELGNSSNTDRSRRKSRRVESWLKEQQHFHVGMGDSVRERSPKASGTPCNPYLAYPTKPRYASRQNEADEDDILGSFVIVEEEESRSAHFGDPSTSHNANKFQASTNELAPTFRAFDSVSNPSSSIRVPRPASILSASPWRKIPFTKAMPSQRSTSNPNEPIDLTTPPASLKIGPVRRRSPIPETFLNADPTVDPRYRHAAHTKASSSTLKGPTTPRGSMRKRLGNLVRVHANTGASITSPTSTKDSSSPRPSTSASATTATTSTAVENEIRSLGGGSPNRFFPKFGISLSKSARPLPDVPSSPTRSSFSTASHEEPVGPSSPQPHVSMPTEYVQAEYIQPEYARPLSRMPSQPTIFRDRRHNASSSALSTLSMGSIGSIATNINGRASSVFHSSTSVKRKRLVVSGLEWDDAEGVQGLRRWCERFGELRQITRMPNGDLHIDFKRADVADTVCRISARVHIAEVGSVNMSWISGKKR